MLDDEGKEEGEEHNNTLNDETCSNIKVKVDNKNKIVINNKNLQCKEIKCYEDEGDYEK